MRDAQAFCAGRFGGANIHTPVEETRIGRNDLPMQLFSQLKRQVGLANRGRADNHDQGKPGILPRGGQTVSG